MSERPWLAHYPPNVDWHQTFEARPVYAAHDSAAAQWPGVPVIPSLSTGATDGRFLTAAGIPTYGVQGMFVDPDGNGVHGLDERIRVRSLMEGRAFLYRLMKAYASGASRPS